MFNARFVLTTTGTFFYNHFSKLNLFKFSTYTQFPVKMSPITIGTHNGIFHCDEVLACYMLKILPDYKDAKIKRTRDLSILDTCDIVVDVGQKYDHKNRRYDHHMRTFTETISTVIKKPNYNSSVKLSSAGLIYCHYGHKIIKQLAPELNDDDLETIFKKVYDSLIKEIDAIDNGVPMVDGEPLYRIVTDLSSRVSKLNPRWNTPHLNEDEQFYKAMAIVGEEFTSFVKNYVQSWLPCKTIVLESVLNRFKVDPSGEIVKLSQACPWKEHLFNIEAELNINPIIKYVIVEGDSFRIIAVPVSIGSFITRKPLPEKWLGLTNEELSTISGIKDCIFVHATGFIGGNKTEEGALQMAREALKAES